MPPIRLKRRAMLMIAAAAIVLGGLAAIWVGLRMREGGSASAVSGIAPVPGVEGQIAALVGGDPIYVYDIMREAAAQGLIASGEMLSPADADYQKVLNELIDQSLLAQAAEARGLDRTPEARRRLQTARERILGNVLLEAEVSVAVTDATVQRMYDEQVRLVELGDEVRARHLMVATREEADAALARLQAGEDFAALVFELSLDGATRLEGGDLGYVTADTLPPGLSTAAYATPVGAVSQPVETELGWHLVRVEDRRAAARPSFDEMRPRIVRFMTFDAIQNLLSGLRESARIQIMTPDIPMATPEGAAETPPADPMAEFIQPAPANPAAGLGGDTEPEADAAREAGAGQ